MDNVQFKNLWSKNTCCLAFLPEFGIIWLKKISLSNPSVMVSHWDF